jgi:Ras-related protein Rab-8A
MTNIQGHAISEAPEAASGGMTFETEEEREERLLAEREGARRAAAAEARTDAAGAGGGGEDDGSKKKKTDTSGDPVMQIKVLLLGDSGVGKTSLMLRYADKKFYSNLMSTLGVDMKSVDLEFEGMKVKLQIWDTAGQVRFHKITRTYYRGAAGILLVYDAADESEETFKNVGYWMENIKTHAGESTQCMLVGNKIDMPSKQITKERGQEAADKHGIPFMEVSAKSGESVTDAFHAIAYDIFRARMLADASTGPETVKKLKDKKNCILQ